MKKTSLLFSLLSMLILGASNLKAQSCDPWITKAYKEIYGIVPNSTQCNIKNYNNGSWSGYCELVEYIVKYNNSRNASIKGDPWIFRAYCELYNQPPTVWEINIKNYNGGSWNGYNDLVKYIKDYKSSLSSQNITFKTALLDNNNAAVGIFEKNKQIGVGFISTNGGTLIGQAGGNLIGQAGGNIIGQASGNIISRDGASFTVKDMPMLRDASGYSVQSAGTKVITTSGKGMFVIK